MPAVRAVSTMIVCSWDLELPLPRLFELPSPTLSLKSPANRLGQQLKSELCRAAHNGEVYYNTDSRAAGVSECQNRDGRTLCEIYTKLFLFWKSLQILKLARWSQFYIAALAFSLWMIDPTRGKNRLLCLQKLTKSAAKVILYSANFVVEGKRRGNPFKLAFCRLFDCDC